MNASSSGLPPRQPSRKAQKSPSKGKRKAKVPPRRGPKGAILGAIVLLALVVGGLLVFLWLPDPDGEAEAGAGSGISAALGTITQAFSDSPSKVIADLAELFAKIPPHLAAIQDEPSRDAAMESLIALGRDLETVQKRIALLEPVPKQELGELGKPYEEEFAKIKTIGGELERIQAAGLLNDELQGVLFELQMLTLGSIRDTRTVLVRMPEAGNEFEQLAYDHAQARRRYLKIIASVEDKADIPEAAAAVEGLTSDLKSLTERKSSLKGRTQIQQADAKYMPFVNGASATSDSLLLRVTNTMDDDRVLQKASMVLSAAEANYNLGNLPGGGSDPGMIPRGPAFPFAGRPGAPTIDPTTGLTVWIKGGWFVEVDQDVVGGPAWVAHNQARFLQLAEFQQELRGQFPGMGGTDGKIINGEARIVLPYTGDVQQFSEAISFGTVESVEVDSRTIVVRMPDLAPAE